MIQRMISLLLTTCFVGASGHAQESSTTLHSTVSGNQEQPRVMYIVPWQRPRAAELGYQMKNELAEDLFGVTDREEFLRELNYREQLNSQNTTNTETPDSN